MIQPFPLLRQPPGSNSCLPTAVRAVLLWYREDATQDEVSAWCQEDSKGCLLDLAIDGLREAEFDIEELIAPTEAEAQALLRTIVGDEDEPLPVIVTLFNPFLSTVQDHAVVVLNIQQGQGATESEEVVEYMDPLTGAIEQETIEHFWQYWYFAQRRAFVILRP